MINATTKSILFNSFLLTLLSTTSINFGMSITILELENSEELESPRSRSNDESSTSTSRSPSPTTKPDFIIGGLYTYEKSNNQYRFLSCIGELYDVIKFNKNYTKVTLGNDFKEIKERYNVTITQNGDQFFIKKRGIYDKDDNIFKPITQDMQKLIPFPVMTRKQFEMLSIIPQNEIRYNKAQQSNELAVIIDQNYDVYHITKVSDSNKINSDESEDKIDEITKNNNNDTDTNQENFSTKSTNTDSTPAQSYFTTRNICFFGIGGIGILAALIYCAYKNNIASIKISELFKNLSLSRTTT